MSFREVPLYAFNQSGGSYLTNMLLELGVCIYSGDLAQRWKTTDQRDFELREEYREYLGFFYPRLMEETHFRFEHGLGIRFNHAFPRVPELDGSALLLVRDPRGVLLSIYDRFGAGQTLEAFLASNLHRNGPRIRPFSLFDLYPAECWALHTSLVAELFPPDRKCVARFEDLKRAPLEEMARVLEWLDVPAQTAEIERAAERSSREAVERATAMWRARYPGHDPHGDKCLKRGKLGAWDDVWNGEATRALGGLVGRVMDQYGYALDASGPREPGGPPDRATEFARSLAGFGWAATRDELVRRARGETRDPQERLMVGLGLQSCRQIRVLFGDAREGPAARRALEHLIGLYGELEGRPLHWLSAARGFEWGGASLAWTQSIDAALGCASSFGEIVELARALFLREERAPARELMGVARGRATPEHWDTWCRQVTGRTRGVEARQAEAHFLTS